MAYVSKEMKAKIAPVIKELCKKYNVKGTLSVRHHTSLVLTIQSGAIDFIENYNAGGCRQATGHVDVNVYWAHEHFTGDAKDFITAAVAALKGPDYFDHSDIQTDYFHTSHYYEIRIGKWDKPYKVTA